VTAKATALERDGRRARGAAVAMASAAGQYLAGSDGGFCGVVRDVRPRD
jgi:hypothetical protein